MVQLAGVPEVLSQSSSPETRRRMADDFSRPAGVGAEPQQHVNLQIQEQCGVGPDAVAYRAVRLTEGDVVEVRILNPSIKEGDRWNALLKRLRLVQLADSPAITRDSGDATRRATAAVGDGKAG